VRAGDQTDAADSNLFENAVFRSYSLEMSFVCRSGAFWWQKYVNLPGSNWRGAVWAQLACTGRAGRNPALQVLLTYRRKSVRGACRSGPLSCQPCENGAAGCSIIFDLSVAPTMQLYSGRGATAADLRAGSGRLTAGCVFFGILGLDKAPLLWYFSNARVT